MKQKVILSGSAGEHAEALQIAVDLGWRVVSNVCGAHNNWMAILERTDK